MHESSSPPPPSFGADNSSGLSNAQIQAAVAVSVPTAILSILGSCCIIHLVIKCYSNRRLPQQQRGDNAGGGTSPPYQRILFGMSIFDIIVSSNYALQYFLMPSSELGNDVTLGYKTTCTVSAVLLQLGSGAFLYYGMLSYFYLLTIRYRVPMYQMAKRYEPWMQCIAIGFSLATSIVGLALNLFGAAPNSSGCWITIPTDCIAADIYATDEDEELSSLSLSRCNPHLMAAIFGLLPWVASFVVILMNNALIFWTVDNTFRCTHHKTFATASSAFFLGKIHGYLEEGIYDQSRFCLGCNNFQNFEYHHSPTFKPFPIHL